MFYRCSRSSSCQCESHSLTAPLLTCCHDSDYTMSTFKENEIDIATKTMVKKVTDKVVITQNEKGEIVEYPYGLLVWYVVAVSHSISR